MSNIFQELKQTATNLGGESTGVTTYEVCKEISNLTTDIASRILPELPTGYGKYVLRCIDGVVQWTDVTVYPTALCFTANTAGSTISLGYGKGTPNTSYEYTTDGETWNEYTIGDTITIAKPGYKVYFRGNNSDVVFSSSSYMQFTMTGSIAASGNIMSILDSTEQSTTVQNYAFRSLFQNCTSLTSAPELPATTLAENCYQSMFRGTSLTSAPELPATTLTKNCYSGMFFDCTSLTSAPELPATTLGYNCCGGMFRGCTSLTVAPELPATSLNALCYSSMFYDCTSLTVAPELPATTLEQFCYSKMFNGCTSLTTAPELPAETLANNCYDSMFYGCEALTSAPELPATTLASNCYNSMFRHCSSLNYIKCLATDITAADCLLSWVDSVAESGTFEGYSSAGWTTGTSGIPSGWTVEDAQ